MPTSFGSAVGTARTAARLSSSWPVAGLLDAVQAAAERQRQWNADGTPRRRGALDERLTDDAAITDALEALSGLAGADVAADSRLAVGDRLRALRGDAATLAGCRSCTACGGRSTTLV